MRKFRPFLSLTLLAATLALTTPVLAAAPAHWVGTWATAPVAEPNPHHDFAQDTTLRQIVHVSLGGAHVRVVLTNELGTESLTIGGATLALPASDGAIQPATASVLTFSGHPSIVIPPGAVAVSDPVDLALPPLSNLAITLFVPGQPVTTLTRHDLALQTSYKAAGNQLTAATFTDAHPVATSTFLKDVEVDAPSSASVVTLGDSITDGAHSTSGANTTWPDILAQRLAANPSTRNLGVLNEGINGNRILHDDWGPNALSRFDRDVLAQAGVKYLIVLEGINDIGHAADPVEPYDIVSANDLIAGLSQLATRAHTHGIKIFGATITPYVGAKYASPTGEAMRQAINQWIRTTAELDGVIDFDKATRDPANPTVFAPASDSGDHLHPGDAGYKIMSDSIDLKLFTN